MKEDANRLHTDTFQFLFCGENKQPINMWIYLNVFLPICLCCFAPPLPYTRSSQQNKISKSYTKQKQN